MITQESIDRELWYFTDAEHEASFELLEGSGAVMLSAPHAVLHTRDGSVRCAERFTGMLCRLAREQTGCPVIYKTRNMPDDANFDAVSDYGSALCEYVTANGVKLVIDLHQLDTSRDMMLCIGTGRGRNLAGRKELPDMIRGAFSRRGIEPITLDEPFAALGRNTVAATVYRVCHVPSVQLELNTRLFLKKYKEYRFEAVLDAITDIIGEATL